MASSCCSTTARATTQRELGVFAQVSSHYDGTVLELHMPGGEVISGEPRHGERSGTHRPAGVGSDRLIGGARGPRHNRSRPLKRLRLMHPDAAERGSDPHPVSMLSQAAVRPIGLPPQCVSAHSSLAGLGVLVLLKERAAKGRRSHHGLIHRLATCQSVTSPSLRPLMWAAQSLINSVGRRPAGVQVAVSPGGGSPIGLPLPGTASTR